MEYLYLYLAASAGAIFGYIASGLISSAKRADDTTHKKMIEKLQTDVEFYKTNLAYTEDALRTIEAVNAKYLRTASELDDKAANLPPRKTDELNEKFISFAFNKDWLPIMLATNPEAIKTYAELLDEVSKCENCGGSGDIELAANSRSIEPHYTSCRECGGSGAIV